MKEQLKSRRWRLGGLKIFAVIRVLTCLLVCLAVSLVALFKVSQARAGDVLVQLGAQLMRLPDAHYANEVQHLSVNGLNLLVQSGSSERSPEDVYGQFYGECKKRGQIRLDDEQRGAIKEFIAEGSLQHLFDGVLVERTTKGTAVACIDPEQRPWDVESLTGHMQRFVASGNLGELGLLRYAWIEPSKSGGSVFLTFWTEGPVALLDMFPSKGDAPGADFPDVARVEGGRRLLSAGLKGSALALYQHPAGGLEALGEHYRAALLAAGYYAVSAPGSDGEQFAQVFQKLNRQVVLALSGGNAKPITATLLAQP
jgi:hypothetical protein